MRSQYNEAMLIAAILYAISSDKHQLKGMLVNTYEIYSEPVTDEMLQKLEMRK